LFDGKLSCTFEGEEFALLPDKYLLTMDDLAGAFRALQDVVLKEVDLSFEEAVSYEVEERLEESRLHW